MTNNMMVSTTTYETHPWTLVTSSFSHQGILHLAMNMIAVYSLGIGLQGVMTPIGYFTLVLSSAVISSAAHLFQTGLVQPPDWQPRSKLVPLYILPDGTQILESQVEAFRQVHGPELKIKRVYGISTEDHVWRPALGASGIASAFLGYTAVLWPQLPLSVFLISTVASRMTLYFGAFSLLNIIFNPDSGIGHAAHMGGLLTGIAAGMLSRGRILRM